METPDGFDDRATLPVSPSPLSSALIPPLVSSKNRVWISWPDMISLTVPLPVTAIPRFFLRENPVVPTFPFHSHTDFPLPQPAPVS